MSVDGFVFVDLETTGTDEENCEILEIGFALYSAELELVERLEILPITTGTATLIDRMRNGEPEGATFEVKMHTENGLFEDLENAIADADELPTDLSGYEDRIAETLTRWGVDATTPLSGTSLRMNRDFLASWMPKIESMFSYRTNDAGVFPEVGQTLDSARTARRMALIAEYGSPTHRVAEDMHYAANVMRVFHDRAPIPFTA